MGKNLDAELAEVAGLDGTDDSRDGTMSVPRSSAPHSERGAGRSASPPSRNLGLLTVLLVMVAGIVTLFMVGLNEAAIYSTPVDQVLNQGDSMVDRRVRIEGELVPGSLRKRDQPCEYRFEIQGTEKRLSIRYPQCVVPDTFRDVPQGGVLVTVEGALHKERYFEATSIMAKCSSKYDPTTHEMKIDDVVGPAASSMIN